MTPPDRPVLLFVATPPDGHSRLVGPGTAAAKMMAKWLSFAGRPTGDGEIVELFEVRSIGGPDLITSGRSVRIRPARAGLALLVPDLAGRVIVGVGHQARDVFYGQAASAPYGTVRTINLRGRRISGAPAGTAGTTWVMPEPVLATLVLVPYPAVSNYRRRRSTCDAAYAGSILVGALRLTSDA